MAKDHRTRRVISSVVERFVHIEDVGGSNPSSPTIFPDFWRLSTAARLALAWPPVYQTPGQGG